MKNIKTLIVNILLLLCLICASCTDVNSYKTYTLTEGTVHFSLEYRAYYKIKEGHPGDDTGYATKDLMYFTLISPKIKETRDYTYIKVIVDKPDSFASDAKEEAERAERMAAKWNDYELINKEEITIDGVKAYRLDYQNQNIVPAIAGVGGPRIAVYREVHFDANGFIWMIQMMSDSTTAEADKPDFEHIIQTFNILE